MNKHHIDSIEWIDKDYITRTEDNVGVTQFSGD